MRHAFQTVKANGSDPSLVDASQWNQPHVRPHRSIAATTAGALTDEWVQATGGSGAGINYTTASGMLDGQSILVTKTDAGAGAVQVLPVTGTINDLNALGAAAYVLADAGQFVELTFDGVNYWVTGKN